MTLTQITTYMYISYLVQYTPLKSCIFPHNPKGAKSQKKKCTYEKNTQTFTYDKCNCSRVIILHTILIIR